MVDDARLPEGRRRRTRRTSAAVRKQLREAAAGDRRASSSRCRRTGSSGARTAASASPSRSWARTPRCWPSSPRRRSTRLDRDPRPDRADSPASSERGQQEIHVEARPRPRRRATASRRTQPADVVGLTFRGRRLQRFRTADGEREMRLTLDEKETESVSQLRNLPLWTATGEKVPLASLADFSEVPGAGADPARQPPDQRLGRRALRGGHARAVHAAGHGGDERDATSRTATRGRSGAGRSAARRTRRSS